MNNIKRTKGEYVFQVINILILVFLMLIMVYPIWHVICASMSDAKFLDAHKGILLLPNGLNFNAYKLMAKHPLVISGYLNTFIIVGFGVFLNLLMTSLGAYFLSRRNVRYGKFVMVMIVITMFFQGGMIPRYLTISGLGMEDTLLALIIPTAINTYNLIIMRTSFMSIPYEIEESAKIDGAGHMTILFKMVLPLSKSIIAVMILYYAVQHWNSWFDAVLFINERELFPLQLVLREILIQNDTSAMTTGVGSMDVNAVGETIKYAIIVTATVPILCVYPFIQKYFVSGVMIGAVKG